jgi:hypothetical protein
MSEPQLQHRSEKEIFFEMIEKATPQEFRGRAPPEQRLVAWCLAVEGHWRLWKGEPAVAEAQLTEALRLVAEDTADQHVLLLSYFIRSHLSQALSDGGAWAEAEKVAREGLLAPGNLGPVGSRRGVRHRIRFQPHSATGQQSCHLDTHTVTNGVPADTPRSSYTGAVTVESARGSMPFLEISRRFQALAGRFPSWPQIADSDHQQPN